jgi:transcriptional regulator with XRE-family HTH domain
MKITDFDTLEALEHKTGIARNHLSEIFNDHRDIGEKTIKIFAIALEVSKVEAYRQIEEVRATKKKKKEI